MDESSLEHRLQQAGASFRAEHSVPFAPARRRPARSRAWLLPLATAAVAATVVVGVTLAPSSAGHHSRPVAHGTPTPRPASLRDIPLPYGDVDTVALSDRYVAITHADLRAKQLRGELEVRWRDRPTQVVATVHSSYAQGSLACPALAVDSVVWRDDEHVPSELIPGPPSRSSLWRLDLRTGARERLWEATVNRGDEVPCPVVGDGKVAWQSDPTHVTVLDGDVRSTTRVPGSLVAVTGEGIVTADIRGGGRTGRMLLRLGNRVLADVPSGTWADGNSERLAWFAADPHGETDDGVTAWSCSLPACADARQVGRGSYWGVVGDGFLAWNDAGSDQPVLVRLDGRPAPRLASGYVFFRAKAAQGHTFAYVTVAGEAGDTTRGPATLHLQAIE